MVQARIHASWQQRVRRDFSTHRYATRDGRALELDLYRPDTVGAAPLILWFHGGAWKAGSRAEVAPLAMAQVARGFAVASVSYSLSSEATWPAQAHEVKAAVRWLRSESPQLGLDPERFVAWGLSAGAQLAAIVGLTADRELEGRLPPVGPSSGVQGVISWYGPADLAGMGRNSILDHDDPCSPESLLLGGPVRLRHDEALSASPVHHVGDRGAPPFLLVHGSADPIVPYRQSEILHRALLRAGVPSELVTVRLGTHVDLRFNTGERRRAAEGFLDRVARRR